MTENHRSKCEYCGANSIMDDYGCCKACGAPKPSRELPQTQRRPMPVMSVSTDTNYNISYTSTFVEFAKPITWDLMTT